MVSLKTHQQPPLSVCHVFEPEAAPSASAKTAQAEAFAKIRLENEFVDIMLESEWAYTENCAKFAFSVWN